MSNKHTPGPWSVQSYQIYADKGTQYGYRLIDCVRGRTQDELEANMALIAAAPELLAAVQGLILAYAIGDDAMDEAIGEAIVASKAALGDYWTDPREAQS